MNDDNDSSRQMEMQLLFTVEQAVKVLGGMSEATIRKHVHSGALKRCEHLGDRPWYFTMQQLQDFTNNKNGDISE
jgi:hypothetical protein